MRELYYINKNHFKIIDCDEIEREFTHICIKNSVKNCQFNTSPNIVILKNEELLKLSFTKPKVSQYLRNYYDTCCMTSRETLGIRYNICANFGKSMKLQGLIDKFDSHMGILRYMLNENELKHYNGSCLAHQLDAWFVVLTKYLGYTRAEIIGNTILIDLSVYYKGNTVIFGLFLPISLNMLRLLSKQIPYIAYAGASAADNRIYCIDMKTNPLQRWLNYLKNHSNPNEYDEIVIEESSNNPSFYGAMAIFKGSYGRAINHTLQLSDGQYCSILEKGGHAIGFIDSIVEDYI